MPVIRIKCLCCVSSAVWATLIGLPTVKAETPTVPSLLQKGVREVLDSLPNQAIFDFSEALLLKPNKRTVAEILGQRSGAYLNKGEVDEATADAEEAVRIDPDYFRGYQARAKIYFVRGKLEKAGIEYAKALRLNPNYAGIYANRGVLLSTKGEDKAAIRDFNTALRLSPGYAEAYLCRGASYATLGQTQKALEDYHRAILADPRQGDAFYDRGLIYRSEGQQDRAISDFTEYIKRVPRKADGYLQRAEVYLAKRDYSSANDDFRQAAELAPDDASTQNEIAWIRATYPEDSMRDGQAAIAAATKACEATTWGNAGYIDTLAAAYAEAGQFDSAAAYEQMTLKMMPHRNRERAKEEKRLAQYRTHQPYRELSSAVSPQVGAPAGGG